MMASQLRHSAFLSVDLTPNCFECVTITLCEQTLHGTEILFVTQAIAYFNVVQQAFYTSDTYF